MQKKIVFTGGGTGGHVYPALAIYEKFKEKDVKVCWIGSKSGIEYKIVSEQNIDFKSIPSGKLRRYFSLQNFIDIFKITAGLVKSYFILLKLKPDVIFSKGGYVTVPVVYAAKLLKIKTITHESDFTPGLATRLNSKFANKILVPYDETKKYFSEVIKNKVFVTGNPVRGQFYNPDPTEGEQVMGFKNKKPVILVLGGSLGARQINELIWDNISDIVKEYNVYHQMGNNNFKESQVEGYITVPFINSNMADIIAAADLVISRSGAGAIWEFATVGTPAILIPLESGSRGDQVYNADYFVSKNVALKLQGKDVTSTKLLSIISDYLTRKRDMENSCSFFKEFNGVQNIVNQIEELL